MNYLFETEDGYAFYVQAKDIHEAVHIALENGLRDFSYICADTDEVAEIWGYDTYQGEMKISP